MADLKIRVEGKLLKQLDRKRGDQSRQRVVEGLVRGYVSGVVDVPPPPAPAAVPITQTEG